MKKVIFTKSLYPEIKKWEEMLGISSTNNMRLLKLYIGMSVGFLLTKDGKILARDFNKVAQILCYRNPRKLIKEAVESGSFIYEKCSSSNWNNYGILWLASPILASEELLKFVTNSTHDRESNCESNSERNMGVIKDNTIYSHSPLRGNGNGKGACAPENSAMGEGAATATDSAPVEPVLHPHGPYEYMFPGCAQRFFDIDNMGQPIPDEAPDRPSATAVWNIFTKRWKEKK